MNEAEQMFIDLLGRDPTPDEANEIRINLWMLERAGFVTDDPTNAPLIAPWAWMWARLPRQPPPVMDHAALAAQIAKAMPAPVIQHRIDVAVFREALRESFSLLWVWVAAVLIGLAGFLAWHYGARHERSAMATEMTQQNQELHRAHDIIDKLTHERPKR